MDQNKPLCVFSIIKTPADMAIIINLFGLSSFQLWFIVMCVLVPSVIKPCHSKISSLNNKYSSFQVLSLDIENDDDGPTNAFNHLRKKRETSHLQSLKTSMTPGEVDIHKFTLKGTEKANRAYVHWVGKDISEKVIVLTSQINVTSAGVQTVVKSQLWRSDDYGTTFEEVDLADAKLSYLYQFPANKKKLLFTDVKAKKLHITLDEAKSFNVSDAPVEPDLIVNHPSDENKMLLYSITTRKLFVSEDSARTWSLLSGNVLPKFYWGNGDYENASLVHMEVEAFDKAEYKACISPKCEDVTEKNKMGDLGPFVPETLLIYKEFMFVQKSYLNGSGSYLMVSYKRQPFQMAYFPGNLKTNDFILLSLDDGQVFVAVIHDDSVNLYLSDYSGHYFVLSFSDVYHVQQLYWAEIDLHEVQGMNWTFLVNKRVAGVPNGVQSYISFDKGGNWGPIPVGNELKKQCQVVKEDCYLQLNIKQSIIETPVISSPSAPGIIVAHGILTSATSKQQPVSLFTSRDGGWTWTKASFDGLHHLNILDQGSILTAIPNGGISQQRSKYFRYSCDEGATWKKMMFDKDGLRVNGVLTEPGSLTLIETLFGQEDIKKDWILMKFNFSSVLEEKCKEEDYESWFAEDYNDVSQNNCTLGRLVQYKRRKQNASCHNGERLIPRVISNDTCECTREDYECDFGFDEHGLKCTKSKWYFEGYLPVTCEPGKLYPKSQGYRKVSADACDEKAEEMKKFGKQNSKCSVIKPRGLSIVTHNLNFAVGREISFYLEQNGGSVKGVTYTWNFGDDTAPQTFTDLKSARHQTHTFVTSGHFNVTVEALAAKGVKASVELTLHVQDELNDMEMITPSSAKVDVPITLSVVVSSKLQPTQRDSDHVHFVWTFGDEDATTRPLLSWDPNVTHTYKKSGKYRMSVEAFNSVGSVYRQYEMEIFDDAEILELEFEGSGIIDIRKPIVSFLLLPRLRYQLSDDLGLKLKRIDTTLLPQVSSSALLYIYPSDDPKDETVDSIKTRVLKLVGGGKFGFNLLGKRAEGGSIIIRVVSAKPYHPGHSDDSHEHHGHGPNLKGVYIGVPVLVLVIICSIVMLCYCRKKHRHAQQYGALQMQDDSDPLLDDDDVPPLDLNIQFRGRDSFRDDEMLGDSGGGSHLVMQDQVENC